MQIGMRLAGIRAALVAMTTLALQSPPAAVAASATPDDGAPSEARAGTTVPARQDAEVVVARVNGRVILLSALRRKMNETGVSPADPSAAQLVQQAALDRLVTIELAYQRAESRGLLATDAQVDAALERAREQYGGEDALASALPSQGLTRASFRDELRRGLTVDALHENEVILKARIPDEQLNAAFEVRKESLRKPERAWIADVFVRVPPGEDAKRPAARAVAERLRDVVLSDPAQNPWALVLDGTFVVRNYEPRLPRDAALMDEARRVGEGALSGVVEAPDGFHVFKVAEYRAGRVPTLDEVRSLLEPPLRAAAISERERAWAAELRSGATIELVPPDRWR